VLDQIQIVVQKGHVMNSRIAGSILLGTSGLVAGLGLVGAQVSNAIVLGGFYAGRMTGVVPPGPQQAGLNWIVIVSAVVLAAVGLLFLFRSDKA
jgi:hypothetical protein